MIRSSTRTSYLTPFDLTLAPLLLLVGTVACLWPVLRDFGSVEFIGLGDPWRYAGPVLFYGDYWIHQGELPLWNPLVHCGQPFAANPQSFLFYPPNLVRSLLTFAPTPYRTHIGILILIIAQMTAGGYGTYLFARSQQFGRGAALAAGIAFGLSGGAVTRAMAHWYFHNALMWFPFLLWAMRCGLLAPTLSRRFAWASVAGVMYGMILLAGTPLFMVFAGLFVGAYAILHRCVYHPWREHRSTQRLLHHIPGDLAALALVLGTGVLVASPLLLPALEFSSFSDRSGSDPSMLETPLGGTLDWNVWELLCIYPGDEAYEAIRGAGAGILILALVGLASARKKELLVYGGLFVFALDCAVDESLVFGRILVELAPYKVSSPGRIALPMCLPLGMLAAIGVETIIDKGKSLQTQQKLTALALLVAAVVLGTLWATVPPHPSFVFGPLPLIVPLLLAIGTILAIWKRIPGNAGMYLALIVLAEIVLWNQYNIAHFPIRHSAGLYPHSIESLKHSRSMWKGNSRITYPKVNVQMYDLHAAVNGYDPLNITAAASTIAGGDLGGLGRLTRHESVANNQHFGFLKRAFWLTRQYVVGELTPRNRPFPYTTTVFLDEPLPSAYPQVDLADLPVRAFSDDVSRIDLLNEACIDLSQTDGEDENGDPIVVLAEDLNTQKHSVLGFSVFADRPYRLNMTISDQLDGEQTFALRDIWQDLYTPYPRGPYWELPLPDFDSARLIARSNTEAGTSAFIEELTLYQDNGDESGLLQIEERTANSVRLTVGPLPAPRILLFVDAYYPGWKAYVDEKPVPIRKANDVFKAVTLGPGTHEVRFVFTSWRVYAGIGMSIVALAGVALLFWRSRDATSARRHAER